MGVDEWATSRHVQKPVPGQAIGRLETRFFAQLDMQACERSRVASAR